MILITTETQLENPNDAALLLAVSNQDREALSALYDRHAGVLFATAIRILNDRTEAEDVLQETMLQIWERASSYRPDAGSAFAWIVTVLRNKAIERLRAAKRRTQLPEKIHSLGENLKSAEFSADLETASIVKKAVDVLPGEQRQAIEMAFFDVMTQQEIADRLQQPLGTVKARIRRGLMRMREFLEGRM